MSDQTDEIQKLLRLKRDELPPEGFCEDFLREFQSRQRSELLSRSARSLLFERVSTYFSGFGAPRWTGTFAGACAAVVIAIFVINQGGTQLAPPEEESAIASEFVPTAENVADSRSRFEFVAPVSLLFSEDLHPTRGGDSFDRPLVEAEGPFSDLYILRNPALSPGSRSINLGDF